MNRKLNWLKEQCEWNTIKNLRGKHYENIATYDSLVSFHNYIVPRKTLAVLQCGYNCGYSWKFHTSDDMYLSTFNVGSYDYQISKNQHSMWDPKKPTTPKTIIGLTSFIKRDNALFTTTDYFWTPKNHVMLVFYHLQHELDKTLNATSCSWTSNEWLPNIKTCTACKQLIIPLIW